MKKLLLFTLFILIFTFAYGSTVSILPSSDHDTNFYRINQHWVFKADVVVNITDLEDSFAAMGVYINYDTNHLVIKNIEYNENIVLDIENNVNGSFTDSNGQVVKFKVWEFDYDNDSAEINSTFLVVKPNDMPTTTNGNFTLFSVFFNPVIPSDSTLLSFCFEEPRLTSFSRSGADQTNSYNNLNIKIDTAPIKPVITFPINDIDTNSKDILISGLFYDISDSVILYVNGIDVDSNPLISDTAFTFSYEVLFQDTYTIWTQTKNSYGYFSKESNRILITYDTAPAEIISTYPEDNDILNYPSVEKIRIEYEENLSGIDTALINIFIDTGSGEINYTDEFSIASNLAQYNKVFTPDTYTVKIQITDKATNQTEYSFSFIIMEFEKPDAITLLNPVDNTDTEFYRTINFVWREDIQVETYQFQIDTKPNFTSVLHNIDNITDTYITINNLDYNNYYWRVRGKNRFFTGEWSDINNIKTGVDLTSPIISSVNIRNPYGHTVIDNTDTGTVITGLFDDNHSLSNIGFFYGLNDTNMLTDNYTISNPDTGIHTYTFAFRQPLNVGDIIYIRLTATDNNNNQTNYYDSTTVQELTVEKPVFIVADTYINRSQMQLYGTKQVRSTVRINDEFTATTLSDTEWERTITLINLGVNKITAQAFIGNVRSETTSIQIIYDNIPPTVWDDITDKYDSEPVLVNLTAHDTHSGVKNIYYSIDGGITYNSGDTILIETEGTYYIRYYAVDRASNTSPIIVSNYPVKLDFTQPDTIPIYDEGNVSIDTRIEFFWDLPQDSSPIVDYFIEIADTSNFTAPLIYTGWLGYTAPRSFEISGDSIVVGKTYYARIKSIDAAGNISDFGLPSSGINIDTSVDLGDPPSAPSLNPVPDKTNVSVITLSGTYPADANSVLINGSPADEMISDSFIWKKTIFLQLGNNPIIVYCRNDTGLVSDSVVASISFNNVSPPAPTFSIETPTNNTPQTISGNMSSTSDTVLLNGNIVTKISDTEWQYELSLNIGNNNIGVVAIDSYGNISDTRTAQIFFNNIPPDTPYVTSYTSPYAGYTQIIEGWFDTTAEIVRVQGNSASINRQTAKWVYTVDLNQEDTNTIIIETEDIAGNISETELVIIRILTPPDVPVISWPFDGHQTALSPEEIRGTKPANSFVYVNGRKADSQNYEDTSWIAFVPLSTGYNVISATSRDNLGNESDDTNILVFYNINLFLIHSVQIDNQNFILKPNNILLTANRNLDLSTLNDTNIRLFENDILINKDLDYDSSTKSIIIGYNFKENSSYRLEIKRELRSEDLTQLEQGREWRFRILINNNTSTTISLNNNVNLTLLAGTTNNPAYYINSNALPISDGRILQANNSISSVISTFWQTLGVAANYYEILFYAQAGEKIEFFNDSFTISISYPDDNNSGIIDNTNLMVENTFMFQLDSDSNIWHRMDSSIDSTINRITSMTDNSGIFTLLSSNKTRRLDTLEKRFILDNGNLIIVVPAGSLSEDIYFDWEILPLSNTEIRLANNNLAGQGFYKSTGVHTNIYRINCYHIDGEHLTGFDSSLTILFQYNDSNNDGVIDNSDITAKLLKPFRLNTEILEWKEISDYSVNEDEKFVQFNIDRLSIFGLLASNISESEVWVYPNPTLNKRVNLLCRPVMSERIKINIVTPFGKNVFSNQFDFDILNPQPVELNLSNLSVGAYFAIIEIDNTKKIIGIGIGR